MKVKTLNGNLNIIGKNLRKYRRLKELSQPAICRELDLLGVTMYNMVRKQLKILKLFLFVKFLTYL